MSQSWAAEGRAALGGKIRGSVWADRGDVPEPLKLNEPIHFGAENRHAPSPSISSAPSNGLGAQLPGPLPRLARSARVQCQTLPKYNWNALLAVSRSALSGGAPSRHGEADGDGQSAKREFPTRHGPRDRIPALAPGRGPGCRKWGARGGRPQGDREWRLRRWRTGVPFRDGLRT